MKKIFSFLSIGLFILFLSFASGFIFAADPTPLPTGGTTDQGAPYRIQCIHTDAPLNTHGGPVKFSGSCSSPSGCQSVICGQTCTHVNEAPNCHSGCTTHDTALNIKYRFNPGGVKIPTINIEGHGAIFPSGTFSNLNGSMAGGNDEHHSTYQVYAISDVVPPPTSIPNTPAPTLAAGAGGQQQGTFNFTSSGTPTPVGQRSTCTTIYWDPYGRVFDAVSLEPLGENMARVTLLNPNGQYVNVPTNNTPIDILGKYNIFLQNDGFYKLKVDSMTEHDFVRVDPNPKYVNLYEKIFRPGDAAFKEEASSPARIDIPVKPKATPFTRPVDWVYKNQTVIWANSQEYTKIEFRVTHPRTLIKTNITGIAVNCQQTGTNTTDKDGFCTFVVSNDFIPQAGVEIQLIKNPNFYLSSKNNFLSNFVNFIHSLLFNKVYAQQSITIENPTPTPTNAVIKFDSILRYIQGYAYDDRGKPILRAIVKIKYVMDDEVFSTVQADNSGFFTISSDRLPPLEYYLEFTDPSNQNKTIQTTSQFVKSNKSYLDSQNLNLMTATKNDLPITNENANKPNAINNNYQPKNVALSQSPTTKPSLIGRILLIFFILVVLIAAAIGVFIYIKRNKPVSPEA